ncbi:MAG TPA: hypothetical protein VGQ59_09885, partial [Cyclobacteriaceae bacterium]|nr:hypothetical protein [Cyclobacteriaceae bacterium]
MIFGNKDSFAIEVGDNIMHSPLRLWVNGKSIGDFKQKDELIDSILNLKMLIKNIESLSEDSFENATPQDIFNWILR